MTVDTRARSAAAALHHAARTDLEVTTMLDKLHERDAQPRTGRRLVAVAAAVVLVLGIGALGWATWHPHASAPPAIQPSPSVVRTTFPLKTPFTAVLPDGWSQEVTPNVSAIIRSPDGPYVQVIMDPLPAATAESPAPKNLTAQSFAEWLAARPELVPTEALRTTVSGLPAWSVDLRLRSEVEGKATCDADNTGCVPLVTVAGLTNPLGLVTGGHGRAIVVQLPNGHIVGVAAGGTLDQDLAAMLAVDQPVIDSIEFTAP